MAQPTSAPSALSLADEAVVQQILAEQPPGEVRSVFPVLLVGLGGTGAEVLRRVKSRISALGLKESYRFLVLDMDPEARNPTEAGPGFEDEEFLLLPRERAVDVLQAPDRHRDLKERFDLGDEDLRAFLLQQAQSPRPGAGQVRPLGLLGFHMCRDAFDELVRKALSSLNARWRTLEERLARGAERVHQQRKTYVVVVSSLCGGTGSSCLIDVAATLRERLRRAGPSEVNALLTLPDVYDLRLKGKADQRAKVAANAYAVLRELDFFQTGKALAQGLKLAEGSDQPVRAPATLFDTTYLVGRRDAAGVDLGDAPAVYDTMALYLTAEIALTVGAKLASGTANDSIRQGMGADTHARRKRIYSTVSASAVGIPFRRLVQYCAYRRLFEYVDGLLKDVPDAPEQAAKTAAAGGAATTAAPAAMERRSVAGEADDWFEGAKLEERGKDQLVGRLKSACFAGPEGFLAKVVRSGAAQLNDKTFLAEFRGATSRWAESDLPKIRQALTVRGDAVLKEALAALKHGQAAWMRRSALHARDVTQHLAKVCRANVAELQKEAQGHQAAAGLAGRDGGALLKRMSSFFGKFGTDPALQERIVAFHRTVMTQQVEDEVKKVAGSIFARLAKTCEDQATGLSDGVLEQLKTLRSEVEARYVGCLPTADALWSDSRAEIDATTPQFFQDTYERITLPASEFRDDLEHLTPPEGETVGEHERQLFRHAALRRALRCYVPQLRGLSVSSLLDAALKAGGERARQASARVEEALAACRPLWLAETGKARMPFSDYLVLGAPEQVNPQTQAALSDAIDKAKARLNADTRYQAEGEVIQTSDPQRIYAVRQSHGGLPHYLTDFEDWKTAYDRWTKLEANPLHIFPDALVQSLPSPEPVEEKGRGERLFALALAYGFVARRGNHYYLNLDRDAATGGFRLAYGSHWEGVAFTEKGGLQANLGALGHLKDAGTLAFDNKSRLDPERRLTGDRGGYAPALKQFESDARVGQLVEEAYSALRQAVSDGEVATELEAYATKLAKRAAPGDALHDTCVRTAALLRLEADELRKGLA